MQDTLDEAFILELDSHTHTDRPTDRCETVWRPSASRHSHIRVPRSKDPLGQAHARAPRRHARGRRTHAPATSCPPCAIHAYVSGGHRYDRTRTTIVWDRTRTSIVWDVWRVSVWASCMHGTSPSNVWAAESGAALPHRAPQSSSASKIFQPCFRSARWPFSASIRRSVSGSASRTSRRRAATSRRRAS